MKCEDRRLRPETSMMRYGYRPEGSEGALQTATTDEKAVSS